MRLWHIAWKGWCGGHWVSRRHLQAGAHVCCRAAGERLARLQQRLRPLHDLCKAARYRAVSTLNRLLLMPAKCAHKLSGCSGRSLAAPAAAQLPTANAVSTKACDKRQCGSMAAKAEAFKADLHEVLASKCRWRRQQHADALRHVPPQRSAPRHQVAPDAL